MNATNTYDVIVVGAGHAGCEAALSAARMGCQVLLVAIDLDKVAAMPCSPSIGGMAKGQLVKEVDALGGEMARITDRSAIQYRTLNTKKGPAVHSSRTQNDKMQYHLAMKQVVEDQANLTLKQALVERLVISDNKVVGIEDHTGFGYQAKTVILATGTFLSGLLHIGFKSIKAGRAGEFAAYGLAQNLKDIGLTLGRMKTGTPPATASRQYRFQQIRAPAKRQHSKLVFLFFRECTPETSAQLYRSYQPAGTPCGAEKFKVFRIVWWPDIRSFRPLLSLI